MKSAEDYFDEACFCGDDDIDAAIVAYTKAIELNPEFSHAFFNRGTHYEEKDDFARAIADYRRFTELCPEESTGFEYLARAILYASDPSLRDIRLALESANRACEFAGTSDYGCYSTLAHAEAELGLYQDAILHQTKAIEIASKNPEAKDFFVPRMEDELEKYRKLQRSNSFFGRLRKLFGK